MNSAGNNFQFSLNASSNYPIFKVHTRITDAQTLLACNHKSFPDNVKLDKSCYDSSLLYSSSQAEDLNGTVKVYIDLLLPKQDYYLTTEFVCKNITIIQYSIIKYDGNTVNHSYRIYEISKLDNSYLSLLENNNPNITEQEYQQKFFFKKIVIVDFSK